MYDDQYDDTDAVYTVVGAMLTGLATLAGVAFVAVAAYLAFA